MDPKNPYEFVDIESTAAVSDRPQSHDHLPLAGGDTFSGELDCSFETLTPLLAANDQYELSDARRAVREAAERLLSQRCTAAGEKLDSQRLGKKKVLEPLSLPGSTDTPSSVVVPGPAIKGMLRHSVSALLSAPMERVQERHFSFRPNMAEATSNQRLEVAPVVIVGVDPSHDPPTLYFEWIAEDDDTKSPHPLVFVNSGIKGRPLGPNKLQVGDQQVARNNLTKIRKNVCPSTPCKRGKHLSKTGYIHDRSARTLAANGYLVVKYLWGLDGDGEFAKAFARANSSRRPNDYKEMLVQLEGRELDRPIPSIKPDVVARYIQTLKLLKDDQVGHLAAHPMNKDQLDYDRVEKNIDKLLNGNLTCLLGTVMFLEVLVEQETEISMGHSYRYRYAYRDSVHHTDRWKHELGNGNNGEAEGNQPASNNQSDKSASLRNVLCPAPYEQTHSDEPGREGEPSRLTAARLMFGYVGTTQGRYDPGQPTTHGIGVRRDENGNPDDEPSDFTQWAGRIAINAAVEQHAERELAERFLNHGQSCLIPLRPLSSPKPSAVEHYVRQRGTRSDASQLVTYGDSADDPSGQLNGRKFYYHQPHAATHNLGYELLPPGSGTGGRVLDKKHQESLVKEDVFMLGNDQAALGRFLSKPNTSFRCRLRLQNLRPWELGSIVLSLAPTRARVERLRSAIEPAVRPETLSKLNQALDRLQTIERENEGMPLFAHKLGHGRPLGLGSVHWSIDAVRRTTADDAGRIAHQGLTAEQLDDSITRLGEYLVELTRQESFPLDRWVTGVLLPWLELHRYAGQPARQYPRKEGGREKEYTVYNHHTAIRRKHALDRKTKPRTGRQRSDRRRG